MNLRPSELQTIFQASAILNNSSFAGANVDVKFNGVQPNLRKLTAQGVRMTCVFLLLHKLAAADSFFLQRNQRGEILWELLIHQILYVSLVTW